MESNPGAIELIEEAIATRPNFSIERLAASLLRDFGGEEGLSAKALLEFEASEPGGSNRKALLDMVFKTLEKAAPEMGEGEGVDPEDLKAEGRALLRGNG